MKVKSAKGLKGVLIGDNIFRVYSEDGKFIDYKMRHTDLSVTIDMDCDASIYENGDEPYIDHDPATLGITVEDEKPRCKNCDCNDSSDKEK